MSCFERFKLYHQLEFVLLAVSHWAAKFKWFEVWELQDLQGNNGKEVILQLISLHM